MSHFEKAEDQRRAEAKDVLTLKILSIHPQSINSI